MQTDDWGTKPEDQTVPPTYVVLCRDSHDEYAIGPYETQDAAESMMFNENIKQAAEGRSTYRNRIVPVRGK